MLFFKSRRGSLQGNLPKIKSPDEIIRELHDKPSEVGLKGYNSECIRCNEKSEKQVLLSGGNDPVTDPLTLLRRFPLKYHPVTVAYQVKKSPIFPTFTWRHGLLEIKGRWLVIRQLPEETASSKTLVSKHSNGESIDSFSSEDSSGAAETDSLETIGVSESPCVRSTDSLPIRTAFPLTGAKVKMVKKRTLKVKILAEIAHVGDVSENTSVIMDKGDTFAADGALILHNGTVYIQTNEAAALFSILSKIVGFRVPCVDDYDFIAPLGKGASGSVYFAKSKKRGEFVAVKVIDKSKVFSAYSTSRHLTDERLLLQLAGKHPFIVGLHAAFQTRDKFYLVTEFCEGGDLFNYLHHHRRKFPEQQAKRIAAEILLGLEEIHQNGFVYRDLKPENILLDKNGHIRLADFGLCRHLTCVSNCRTNSFCGTRAFISPEMLQFDSYGFSVDIWSFGVLLYDMLCGKSPFYHKNRSEMYRRIKGMSLCFPEDVSDEARSLLDGLLKRDPSERLGCRCEGIGEIKKHPFFADIDWNMLIQDSIRGQCMSEWRKDNVEESQVPQSSSNSGLKDNSYLLRNFDMEYLAKRSITPVLEDRSHSSSDETRHKRSGLRRGAIDHIFKPLLGVTTTKSSSPGYLLGFEFGEEDQVILSENQRYWKSCSSSVGSSLSSHESV